MLSALRGILQRWVGMTTEVQTVEAGEATAVPAATPTCSADYAASAATRRLKRTGGITNEAADLKRPRTAPATPIDPNTNGGNPPAGKLTSSDTDSRIGGPTDNHNLHATRPSTTASAPAALNRALRSQPSVSTSTPSATPGSCSASGAFAPTPPSRHHCGAISGVLTAPQPQMQPLLQPLQQQRASTEDNPSLTPGTDPHQLQQQQQQLQHHNYPSGAAAASASLPLQLLPALHRAAAPPATAPAAAAAAAAATPSGGGGGENLAPALGSIGGPPRSTHTPHPHSHSHHHNGYTHGGVDTPQALHPQHPHHRHDALEEQVFSPAFHLPASASASAASSAQASPASSPMLPLGAAAAALKQQPQGGEAAGPGAAVAMAVAAADSDSPEAAAVDVDVVELRSTHAHGPGCTQLHAIDLNVVEGVVVDTDDDEAAVAVADTETDGPAATEAAAAGAGALSGHRCAATAGASGRADAAQQQQQQGKEGGQERSGRGGKAKAAAAEDDDGGPCIAAVSEELSSSSDEEEEEEGREEGEGGSGRKGNGGGGDDPADAYECENDENAPLTSAGAAGAPRAPGAAAWAGAATQQQQQAPDAVLVASAPRGLAAAVSAALPVAQQHPDDDEGDEDEGLMEFDPLVFIKQLPPLENCVPANRPLLLPVQSRAMARRKTLVLDLDETLVHSSLEAVERSDFSFPVVFNGTEHQVYVRQRPHLRDFMVRVSALFEVVVFTASQRIYAERLLDILDPEEQLVLHRIYRDSCVVVDGNYLKDLSILGRGLAHTVIVDNSPQAFGFQVDNGIPIESWYDDDQDMELIRLLPFLESLAGAEVADVRPRIKSQFRLRELIDRA